MAFSHTKFLGTLGTNGLRTVAWELIPFALSVGDGLLNPIKLL